MRYPASEKAEIIELVEQSHLPAKRTLDKLGIEPEYPEPELEYDADAEEYYAWMEEEERKEKAGEKPPFDPKDAPF